MTARTTAAFAATKHLAIKAPLTPSNVDLFVKSISLVWKLDPEVAHVQEFELRSRVIKCIAQGKLRAAAARTICGSLDVLASNRSLERWFS